jgi:2-polyprenyl-6-methoxyphenol hydroxylase-like FAD-dependent oxidoreductase
MSERVGQAVDVLVPGAGPTGLTLGLQAHDHGARVRVVERRAEAFRPSRALIVHPRTLEVLRPLVVTEALLTCGDSRPLAELHLGRRVVPVQLAGLDLPDTAFPHLLMVRQADVEAVLDALASTLNAALRWRRSLTRAAALAPCGLLPALAGPGARTGTTSCSPT